LFEELDISGFRYLRRNKVAEEGKTCSVKGCKRPYRAKGYCTVHYNKWRRGELPKSRFKTCNFGVQKLKRGEKKECLKHIFRKGLCEEHYKATLKKKGSEATETAEAAAS
jgi:hypothetical protein